MSDKRRRMSTSWEEVPHITSTTKEEQASVAGVAHINPPFESEQPPHFLRSSPLEVANPPSPLHFLPYAPEQPYHPSHSSPSESKQQHSLRHSSPVADTDLTYSNLVELQADSSLPRTPQFPQPFDSVPRYHDLAPLDPNVNLPDSPSRSQSQSLMTTTTHAESKLTAYRFFIDRGTPMPADLKSLVADVQKPRSSTVITPDSKRVAGVNPKTKFMLDNDSKQVLLDRLVYHVKLIDDDSDDEGEEDVWRGIDHPWGDHVPQPQGGPPQEEKDLQEAMESPNQTPATVWVPAAVVYTDAPWFPYLIVEWKGKDKTIQVARFQARRDCPPAINALYKLFIAAKVSEPSAKSTCMFSLCVDSNIAEHRIHWRHVDPMGRISYEAEIIAVALLADESSVFKLRGTLLNALKWVRGDRLEEIRKGLNDFQKPQLPPPSPIAKPPKEKESSPKSSKPGSSTLQPSSSSDKPASSTGNKKRKGSH
ncbi:MAG: hypothetical protein Q9170_006516 [Blastenia crenularia]